MKIWDRIDIDVQEDMINSFWYSLQLEIGLLGKKKLPEEFYKLAYKMFVEAHDIEDLTFYEFYERSK